MERDMTVGNPAKVIFNFTVPIFSRFRHSAFVWYAVSAVLQYGGYDHSWKVCWNKSIGGSRIDGNDYVSDHYKSDWTDCRFYGDDCAKIWCGRYERDAKDCCDGSSAVGSDFGCDYDYKYAGNA